MQKVRKKSTLANNSIPLSKTRTTKKHNMKNHQTNKFRNKETNKHTQKKKKHQTKTKKKNTKKNTKTNHIKKKVFVEPNRCQATTRCFFEVPIAVLHELPGTVRSGFQWAAVFVGIFFSDCFTLWFLRWSKFDFLFDAVFKVLYLFIGFPPGLLKRQNCAVLLKVLPKKNNSRRVPLSSALVVMFATQGAQYVYIQKTTQAKLETKILN